ncbi:hypothetical protein [Arthrobacter sp. ISL-65]|uniref:hypothetical protein n=1 Tax=Arthrobacter sp. ISL-65 TaxID=2819112 RepID=UPI001BEB4F31|nr:hypothetical protein [Arthrobacter sp. ISL-65]MBT2550589.1 hypothetical protein [Arthrobacter sp. ISL-65]
MRRREIWGIALLAAAGLTALGAHAVLEADRAATSQRLLLYVGVPASNIGDGLMILAILTGAAGIMLLLPALIGRIPRTLLRRTIGWTTGMAAAAAVPYLGLVLVFAYLGAVGIGDTVKVVAADGQSVLVTQDGFDGDIVDIYTEHDEFHYKWARRAPEISGWPRVKDQDCRLDATGGGLQFACGVTRVDIGPKELR